MPIRIIENTSKRVVADYIGKDTAMSGIKLAGDFTDIKLAREEVARYLLMRGVINAGQYLGFISAIRNPRSKDYYSSIGKKGLDKRWSKK